MTEYQKIEKKVSFFVGKPVSVGVYGIWLAVKHGFRGVVNLAIWLQERWATYRKVA